MANRTRNLAVAAVAAAVLGTPSLCGAADAMAVDPSAPVPHVRSSSADLLALIHGATEQSETFRRLVDRINASDSLVFVEAGHCGHGVRACFVSVTSSKTNRYMRVIVDTRKADWDLMGSIGHELRHTIEVIDNPHVRDSASKYFFYEQNGSRGTGSGARETDAAIDAGNTVRAEVRRFSRQAVSEK